MNTRQICSTFLIGVVLLLVGVAAFGSGQDKLYRVRSQDVGWNTIDLTITELRRDARTSFLNVPRYGNRTSVESRFAMCAFTDLTFQRGFAFWLVAYPYPDNDHVLLGFLKSADEDPRAVLGEKFVGKNVLKADAQAVNRMCGIREPKK